MDAFGGLGTPEIMIIVLVDPPASAAKKLPDLARGTGRALRIFKAETKGLMTTTTRTTRPTSGSQSAGQQPPQAQQPPQQLPPSTPAADPATPRPGPASDPLPPTHTEK